MCTVFLETKLYSVMCTCVYSCMPVQYAYLHVMITCACMLYLWMLHVCVLLNFLLHSCMRYFNRIENCCTHFRKEIKTKIKSIIDLPWYQEYYTFDTIHQRKLLMQYFKTMICTYTVPCSEKSDNTRVYTQVHSGIHATSADTTRRHG